VRLPEETGFFARLRGKLGWGGNFGGERGG
jgi:hypothetical protein